MSLERRMMHLRMIPGGIREWISWGLFVIFIVMLPYSEFEVMERPFIYY